MRAEQLRRPLLALLAAAVTGPAAADPAAVTGSYFAVIVSDVDAAAEWYAAVLRITPASRFTESGQYDVINLSGPGVFVELLDLEEARDRPEERLRGPFKAGLLVDDLEAFVAGLPDSEPEPRLIHDAENRLSLIQLHDPDGNIVQVMSIASTPEASPD